MNIETTDLRVYKTRQSIKESVLALLEIKPLSEITVTELSSKAIINRKTFYRHYQTVNDVVRDIESDIVETLVGKIKEQDISCLDVTAVLKQIGFYIDANKASLEKITKLTPDIFINGKLEDMLKHTILVSLRKNAEAGSLKEHEYVASFMVSGLMALYIDWFKNDCRDDLNILTATVEKLISRGVSCYLSDEQMSIFSEA